jgi:nicotinamidase-related amidase
VLCIECQQGVIGPDSMLPALAEEAQSVIPGIRRLVTAARDAGALVAHATFEGFLGGTEHGSAPLWRATGPASASWGPGHPATQVLPELLDPRDLVIPRHHGLNPTWGNELLPVLRSHGIRTLVLAGVSLNVALPLAAGEAMHEGFRVLVPRDAVAGSPAEYGEQILRNTISMLAKVTTVDDVAAAFADASVSAKP